MEGDKIGYFEYKGRLQPRLQPRPSPRRQRHKAGKTRSRPDWLSEIDVNTALSVNKHLAIFYAQLDVCQTLIVAEMIAENLIKTGVGTMLSSNEQLACNCHRLKAGQIPEIRRL